MGAAILHAPTTAAQIERLLMRWPCSLHLKLQLAKAKKREARARAKARAEVLRRIHADLKTADLPTLQAVAAQIQEAVHA
jgi:hypothetical protein